jgi:IS30 family transposase
VDRCIQQLGGYAPTPRRRAARALTLAEREEISRGVSAEHSIRRIARQLQRCPSSISREIARNGGRSRYRAAEAEHQAAQRALRPKRCVLAQRYRLRCVVAQKLAERWSPQQISGWLVEQFPQQHSMRVSHETIYRTLFVQSRGVLKKQLLEHLRSGRKLRYPQGQLHVSRGPGNQQIPDPISIRERPAEVEDRAVPGHWEGDLLIGTTHSRIATLVERQSRYVMLVKLPARDSATVVAALTKQILTLPQQLRRSLTWDRGAEMSYHKHFTVATDVQVYFCDPHSPWQRGSNENTNGLLRQYFPKGKSMEQYSQAQLNAVAKQMNQRPRQTLGFKAPADILQLRVATTG